MIYDVRIENLAVIESLEIHFGTGFTALTGETGAGKSLLIQALSLIAGERASADVIRQGAGEALIEARLSLTSAEARTALAEQGYSSAEPDNDQVLVRRLLRSDGNHRVYVNGRLATTALLQDLIAPELEIHAQHSQQRLLQTDVQRRLLDRYGALSGAASAVAEAYNHWQKVLQQIDDLEHKSGNREQELDYLKFQLDEFDQLKPQANEQVELEQQLARLEGGAERAAAIASALELLHDGDNAALDRLYSAAEALAKAAKFDNRLQNAADSIEALAKNLQQLCRDLPHPDNNVEETNIEALRQRKVALDKLARKHGGNLAAAICAVERMRQTYQQLQNAEAALAGLRTKASGLEKTYRQKAETLSRERKKCADKLAVEVIKSLQKLEMPHARFTVSGWGQGKPRAHGIDDIQFELAANPGDQPRPLRRVASGGEMSRILLAIQTAIGLEHVGGTVVFDEADAGIGGETAVTVGATLRKLGERYQVLVVTHTPQVAAAAHQQIHLEKGFSAGRAFTYARNLDADARVRELAGMLGVRDTASALEHARTLLASST